MRRLHLPARVLWLALLSPLPVARAAAPAPPPLMQALEAELARTAELRLPDAPPPYLVSYEVLDGEVATAEALFGALSSTDDGPYRMLRVDVRVGDYALDSGNFEGNFGDRSGTRMRLLPDEDEVLALRRELWLATDEAYKGATEQLSSKLAAREGSVRELGPDLLRVPPLVTEPALRPAVPVEPLEALVQALSARLQGQGLEEGRAVARSWQGVRVLASTEGHRAWLPTGFAVLRVEAATRAADGALLRDAVSWVVPTPAQLPPMAELEAEVDQMVAWLQGLRQAPVEEDYLGPVLFEGPAAMEVFRQLLAPELAGTPAPERPPEGFADGEQVPTARIGRRLLPEGWTVVDDPVAAREQGLAGGYDHDFEGVAAERVELVQDGVVRRLLMSRVPREGMDRSTGHGRSLGADRRVAMTAAVTVQPARPRSPSRLERKGLALARQTVQPYLLVVERLEPPALAEDFRVAFSGEAPLPGLTRPTRAWRLYPDGRREPVRGLSFVGVDRRVLRDVVLAGRVQEPRSELDAEPGPQRFGIGVVGGLPVTWSVPPVLVGELELHGAGGREQRVLPPPEIGLAGPVRTD
ncbi:metallopeptidase TldD-related protein [Myxococcota bacterium]|nr:metallopeptidase TldD-related protein [Myxococcota bacterium]